MKNFFCKKIKKFSRIFRKILKILKILKIKKTSQKFVGKIVAKTSETPENIGSRPGSEGSDHKFSRCE